MRHFRSACAIVALVLLAACAPRREPPAPAPAPPAPPPAPAPPAPPPLEWQDAPLSPGDWSYRSESAGVAQRLYGAAAGAAFLVPLRRRPRDQPGSRRRRAGSSLDHPHHVRRARACRRRVQPDGLVASLPAADPLLDQMVFSRGRFAVQAEGADAADPPRLAGAGAGDRGLPRAIKKRPGRARAKHGILAAKKMKIKT